MEGFILIDRLITNGGPQHDRNRTYEPDVSTLELSRAQEASYPLPVNLLSI